jgi:L-ascorbate metabolism protein UlaG (beta-lactamase superfamily)
MVRKFAFVLTLICCFCLGLEGAEPAAKVTYVANEGFLVELGDSKILVDALFHDQTINWCHVSDSDTLESIERAKAPFDDVDLILITHWHIDHFNPTMVLKHLRSNPDATVVGSPQVVTKLRAEQAWTKELEGRVREIDLAMFDSDEMTVRGIRLVSHRIRHNQYLITDETTGESRNKHEQVENLAYLVEVDGVRFAHFGDAFLRENKEFFDGVHFPKQKIDMVFLEGWSPETLAIVDEWMTPDQVIFMHMPSDEERLDRVYNYLTETIPNAVVFREPMTSRSF